MKESIILSNHNICACAASSISDRVPPQMCWMNCGHRQEGITKEEIDEILDKHL